jgi:hypothetical protein
VDRATYTNWAEYHAGVFMFTAEQTASVIGWFDIFRGFGFTRGELDAATKALAADPPEFPNQHLARVQLAVGAARRDREKADRLKALGCAAEPTPGEVGVCALCSDSGQVVVPHPRAVGRDPESGAARLDAATTCAVACLCWRGRKVLEAFEGLPDRTRQDAGGPPLTLAEYRRQFAGGERLLAEYERAAAESAREQPPPPGTAGMLARFDAAIDKACAGIRGNTSR